MVTIIESKDTPPADTAHLEFNVYRSPKDGRLSGDAVTDAWKVPQGHPLSIERAKELIAGDLGDTYRSILSGCCAPIYWHQRHGTGARILNSGTLTFVQTPKRLMAITAAHVVRGYESDHADATWPIHL